MPTTLFIRAGSFRLATLYATLALLGGCARTELSAPVPVTTRLSATAAVIVPAAVDLNTSQRQALQGGRPPVAQVSTFAQATPFDINAWKANPEATARAYAQVTEPSRVLDDSSAPDAPPLELLTLPRFPVPAGGKTEIRVKAAPFAPVSAASEDKGTFANGLTSTTVVADAAGVASLALHAGVGVHDEIRVHISSPVAAGRLMVIGEVR